jgi:beta-galactosidase
MTSIYIAMPNSKSVAQGQSLLPQGAFEQADAANKPAGWDMMLPQNTSLAGDTKNHWVQLRDGATLSQVVKLNPSSKKIVVSARLKLSKFEKGPEGWHGPRIALKFLDANNAPIEAGLPTPDIVENTDWATKQVTFDVPAGATQLQIQPGLWGSKGLLEIDDITVKAYAADAVMEAAPAADAPWPSSAKVKWGNEANDVQSAKRARISLNGAWKFSPAQSNSTSSNATPTEGWGYIQVPGSWRENRDIIEPGSGPQWAGFDGSKLAGAWYERKFKVPADWNGRHISIDFQRISTDATVWINDKPAGKINWPEGELDITSLVTPGQEVTLRAFVVATIDEGEAMVLMGMAPGQNWTAKKEVQSGGIVGNVTLQSRPRGAHVSDVYLKPSTRLKQLGADIELSDVTQSGPVQIVASLLNEKGVEEKRFMQTVNVTAQRKQRVQAAWPWPNPRLWDFKQPNLYKLRLAVKGAGVDDEPVQSFGFREVWTQGRHVYLNGTIFRVRPVLLGAGGGEAARKRISEVRELGYNFGEQWPGNVEERSQDARHTDLYDITDREGFPVSGIMPHMGWLGGELETPERTANYRAQTERVMRRYRNHPSIIFWGTSGNMMGGSLDPNNVGVREEAKRADIADSSNLAKAIPLAEKGIALIKSFDKTRPVFIHFGGPTGDIYTINNYLNFIPLQEREEWLSNYAQKGDMPLMYVEFGTPVSISLMRGRNGFQGVFHSENLMSEYSAIYLGDEAYKLEPADYRKRSAEIFQKDQAYGWSHGMKERDYAPAWLKLQNLFITNTWRSWRTMGMTGGMIPWDGGYAQLNGQRTIAGDALHANNNATLAWITGAAKTGDIAAFTAKDHAFYTGQKISKQVALLNDSRVLQKYSLRWTATVNNGPVASGEKSGTLAVGQTLFVPFEFVAPATTTKTDGKIVLTATVGTDKHNDSFDFRVWPRAVASKGTVSVFDPEGKTTAMLRNLGYTATAWNGQSSTRLLVIGRNALKSGATLPGDLKKFVQSGGRVLLSGHDPHWLRENMGVRVSYLQSRRVWKVGENAATSGLDNLDLRDWRGHSTLLNPRPDHVKDKGKGPDLLISKSNFPYAGWRWGNRGTVASAAIEKPHRSGWRPLLEAEFDLAYSPLMELDFGKGKILWSQLDLEDHAALDPAARKLARGVIEYSIKAPLAPRVVANYIGGDAGNALLKALGVQFKRATALPTSGLVIVGADATVGSAQLENFARAGGKVLFLARRDTKGVAGLQLQQKADFIGSLQAPNWAEARGLSASDLRWRNVANAWVATSGSDWQIGADGLLARRAVGNGVMLWSQIDPNFLPADEKTYFRFTRWRQTRALSQVLANLGASFEMDARIFSPRAPEQEPSVALGGEWRARLIQRFDAAPSADEGPQDNGISEEARRAIAIDFNDKNWQVVETSRDMGSYGGTWANADGEAVFRKVIEVPQSLLGQDLKLSLGSLDDYDDTYFNGVRVGGIGKENANAWSAKREYSIPASLVKAGKNVIAVRIWDRYGGGGFTSSAAEPLTLKSTRVQTKPAGFYHPDYREDWELGDEPYRYYNW